MISIAFVTLSGMERVSRRASVTVAATAEDEYSFIVARSKYRESGKNFNISVMLEMVDWIRIR
jgi:hypothetical protein